MNIQQTARVLLSGLCLLGACNGTETGNPPVIDFGNSGCHDQSYGQSIASAVDKGVIVQSLDMPTLTPDPQYKGLTCLVWNRVDADTVRIELTNYESGCGSDSGWQPRAELQDDGTLALILQDSDCSSASCGWCLFDLSFTVHLHTDLKDGPVRVSQQGCQVDALETKHATLALASQTTGAVCNYANANALIWKGGTDGSQRMPCGSATGPAGPITCQQDLLCTDVGTRPAGDASGGDRCLPICTSDADCAAPTRCQASTCQLTTVGLSSDRAE